MNGIAIVTDYDLDGVGSSIMLKNLFPNYVEHSCQGPRKIERNLKKIVDKGNCNILVTADLSYPEDLLMYALDNFNKVLYIDHHESSESFQSLKVDNFILKYNPNISSTAISYQLLREKKATSRELSDLAVLIDVYDCWRKENPRWEEARALSELFWHYGYWDFEARFWFGFDRITDNEWEIVKSKINHAKDILNNSTCYEIESGCYFILSEDLSGLSVMDDIHPDLYLYFYTVILENGDYKVSVRYLPEKINCPTDCIDLSVLISHASTKFKSILNHGGHKYAGGFTFDGSLEIEYLVEACEYIYSLVETELEVPF